jgi:hypothetical protein
MQLIARRAYTLDAYVEAQLVYRHNGENLVCFRSDDPAEPTERWETWADAAVFSWLTEAPEQIALGQGGQ